MPWLTEALHEAMALPQAAVVAQAMRLAWARPRRSTKRRCHDRKRPLSCHGVTAAGGWLGAGDGPVECHAAGSGWFNGWFVGWKTQIETRIGWYIWGVSRSILIFDATIVCWSRTGHRHTASQFNDCLLDVLAEPDLNTTLFAVGVSSFPDVRNAILGTVCQPDTGDDQWCALAQLWRSVRQTFAAWIRNGTIYTDLHEHCQSQR